MRCVGKETVETEIHWEIDKETFKSQVAIYFMRGAAYTSSKSINPNPNHNTNPEPNLNPNLLTP